MLKIYLFYCSLALFLSFSSIIRCLSPKYQKFGVIQKNWIKLLYYSIGLTLKDHQQLTFITFNGFCLLSNPSYFCHKFYFFYRIHSNHPTSLTPEIRLWQKFFIDNYRAGHFFMISLFSIQTVSYWSEKNGTSKIWKWNNGIIYLW